MEGLQAERPMALPAAAGPLTTPFGTLSWSQARDLALPGAVIGMIGGAVAGGLAVMGGLSIVLVLAAGLGLAVPLALAGGTYDLLLAKGKLPLGTLAPAALLWVILFPPIRVVHAALLDLAGGGKVAVPHGWAAFVIYQVLVAVPFAIGFWWLHENFAPRWWFHIRKRNPVADHWIRVQLDYAEAAEVEKQRRNARHAAKRAKKRR